MRRIYLVRHGRPEFPDADSWCIGRTDFPLGTPGRLQACILGGELESKGLSCVFCSCLSRAIETARFISQEPVVLPGLEEMYAGDWDGKSFTQIKAQWPELFALRGVHPETPIPGSEDIFGGQRRFAAAVDAALEQSDGDIAIVAHATVIQSFICLRRGISPLLGRRIKLYYGSYCAFEYEGGQFSTRDIIKPLPELTRALSMKLLDAAEVADNIKAHCLAVERFALDISKELTAHGAALDTGLISSAALLHDIARQYENHAALGAQWLGELGYPEAAEIIRQHHDLESEHIDEAAVLYIADKCVREDSPVSLEERFAASRAKCSSPESLKAHNRRFNTALTIKDKMNNICGKELIS